VAQKGTDGEKKIEEDKGGYTWPREIKTEGNRQWGDRQNVETEGNRQTYKHRKAVGEGREKTGNMDKLIYCTALPFPHYLHMSNT
jgi:hypothetical protein